LPDRVLSVERLGPHASHLFHLSRHLALPYQPRLRNPPPARNSPTLLSRVGGFHVVQDRLAAWVRTQTTGPRCRRFSLDPPFESKREGDFSVRIRSRGHQSPENHRWEVSLSTGIGITKHYAVTYDQSQPVQCHHKPPRSRLLDRLARFRSGVNPNAAQLAYNFGCAVARLRRRYRIEGLRFAVSTSKVFSEIRGIS
jgi:hypothetical protein